MPWAAACALIALLLGAATADERVVLLPERSGPPSTIELPFTPPPYAIEHQVRLALEGRIDAPTLRGSNHWLRVAVNGTWLTAPDLLNKPNEFMMANGADLTWARRDAWRLLYSPDFEAALRRDGNQHALPEADPYRYVWDITPYLKPADNKLTIVQLPLLAEPETFVLRNVAIEVGRPITPPAKDPVRPAPTGEVPTYLAQGAQRLPLRVSVGAQGGLAVKLGERQVEVQTRTSLPAGRWHETANGEVTAELSEGQSAKVAWTTECHTVARTVTVRADHVHIADTLTNPTDRLVGIIIQHRSPLAQPPKRVVVAGNEAPTGTMRSRNYYQPASIAVWDDFALGLLAEDDIFRVHVDSFVEDGKLGLGDDRIGLEPGKAVTLEWSIYPVPGGDYWDVVNAVRRNWRANFTIPGPFSFSMHFREDKPAEWYGNWVRSRNLKIVCGGIAQYPDGKYAHGTGIMFAPAFVARERDWTQKMLAAAPEVKALAYFHAQASTEPDGEAKYADAALIDSNGKHLGYPYRYRIPLYLPTRDNSYGKALWGYVKTALDDIGVSGLYWDEMSHSVLWYDYGPGWDGISLFIDPESHEIVRKVTCVPLVMQGLKLDIIRHLRERGQFLMANTPAETRTLGNEQIVRFVETGTYRAVMNTHYSSPLGLGNHGVEDNQADRAEGVRRILEYGGLYYGHIWGEDPPAWTFQSVMYPITPTELHQGVVLGEERIHTTRSGRFGWPDGAAAEIYVVDAAGNRVAEPNLKDVGTDGRHLYELRIPSDQFAVLVKKAP